MMGGCKKCGVPWTAPCTDGGEHVFEPVVETFSVVGLPMLLWCPACGERHIDEGEFATRAHHTHACQHCGMVWRPAITPTVGVRFLSGFKNEEQP